MNQVEARSGESFQKVALGSLVLYSASLLTSMGAMESISTLTFFAALSWIFISSGKGREFTIKEMVSSPAVVLALLFLVCGIISALGSPMPKYALDSMGANRGILLMIVLGFFWQDELLNPKGRWINVLLGTGGLVAIYAIYQFFNGADLVRGPASVLEPLGRFYRSSGFFSLPLTFAYSLGMAIFLLLPFGLSSIHKEGKAGKVAPAILLLMTIALMSTGVRGAWIAFAITFGLFLFHLNNERLRWILVGMVAGVSGTIVSVPVMRQRLMSSFDLENLSNLGRLRIWDASYHLWQEHPIWGVGLNISDQMVGRMYAQHSLPMPVLGQSHHAHNDFLQVLLGTGVVGLIFYSLFMLFFLFISYKGYLMTRESQPARANILLGCFLALVYFNLGSLTQCNYTDREVNHILTFIMCLALVNWLRLNRVEPAKAL